MSTGLRPGGFSSYTENLALAPFAEEHVTAYAAGWDAAVLQRHLEWAARVFYDDIRNYQIERSFTPSAYFVATAPRARRSFGAETEVHRHPAKEWTGSLHRRPGPAPN